MRKQSKFLFLFLLFFSSSLFSEQLVLERKVTNHVQRYYDKTWFDEAGTVRLYVNEFTSASGKEKFGWAYAIDTMNEKGVKLVSGASANIYADVVSGDLKVVTPYESCKLK